MKKTEKLSILISIVLISLLAISAVSAAEIDDNGSLTIDDKTKNVDTTAVDAPTTDNVGTKESEPATADTTPKESEPATVGNNPTTEIEKSFTQLNKTINEQSSSDIIYLDNHYRYDDQSESDNELQTGIVLKGKHVIDGQNNMIDAAKQARIFTIDTFAEVTLQNIIFKGAKNQRNDETGYGGAIYSTGLLKIINCTFEDNNANEGGAIYSNYAGRITIEDSTFKSNQAEFGGAIFITEGVLDISNTEFIENNATYAGGAIYTTSQFTITNSKFTDNLAKGKPIEDLFYDDYGGGAIYTETNYYVTSPQAYSILNTTFTSNEAYTGGAIYIDGQTELDYFDTITIDNCTFEENTMYEYGGAIDAQEIYLNINNSIFKGNGAAIDDNGEYADYTYGGAINAIDSYVEVNTSNFILNAAQYGGAIGIADTWTSACQYDKITSALIVSNSNFIYNFAEFGGAILAIDTYFDVTNSNFTSNFANNIGGALYLATDEKRGGEETGIEYNIISSNFNSNYANIAGAISIDNMNNNKTDYTYIFDSNFTENEADISGGAIYAMGTKIDIDSSNFISNAVNQTTKDLEELNVELILLENGLFANKESLINTVHGGAITSVKAILDIEDSAFINNTATADDTKAAGGAIAAIGNIIISNTDFYGNIADTFGGAITADFANLTINEDSYFELNRAQYGGAISSRATNITLSDTNFVNNFAEKGGAIAIKTDATTQTITEYSFISGHVVDLTTFVEWSTGTVEPTGREGKQADGQDCTEIIVTSNTADESYIGKKYWIFSFADTEIGENTAFPLYEEKNDVLVKTEISVKITSTQEIEKEVASEVSVLIDDCGFEGNGVLSDENDVQGGAIYIGKNIAKATITDSDFISNGAITLADDKNALGGAIATYSPLTIDWTLFEDNTVTIDEDSTGNAMGGAIYTEAKIIVNTTGFKGNDIIGDDDWWFVEYNDFFGRGTAIAASSDDIGKTCVLENIELLNNEYPLYAVFYNIYDPTTSDVTQIRETIIEVTITNNTKDNVTLSILVKTNHTKDYGYGKVSEILPYAPVNITFENLETGKTYEFDNVTSTELFTTSLPIGNYSVLVEFEGLEGAKNQYYDPFEYDYGAFWGYFEVVENPYKTIEQLKEDLDKTIKELEDTITEKNAEIDALKEERNELQRERDELQKYVAAKEAEILMKDLQIAAKNAEIAKLQNETQNLTKQLNETKAKLNDANTANAQLNGQIAEANKQLQASQDTLRTTQATLTNTQNTLISTQSQLTTEKNKANDANAKIKKVKAPSKIKKSKKLKITVTLNKKVKGKYVYVVFNGKAYKAKTNKKGVAKVTIKKSALKKLGGKKIKYQAIYNQSLKNKSIKIKK